MGERYRNCCMFLLTFTYSRAWPIGYAWRNVTKDLSMMRIQLKRELEARFGVKVSIRSITSKEGSESGYPAPHMLIIFDHPILCTRYKGRGHSRYIIQDNEWKKKVFGWMDQKNKVYHQGKIWHRGYVDVRGIVGNKIGKKTAVGYSYKYMTKACKCEESSTAFKTCAWHYRYNLRAIQVSAQFKQMLNPARLDRTLHESQQILSHYWVFDHVDYCLLDDFFKIMSGCGPPLHGNSYMPVLYWTIHEKRDEPLVVWDSQYQAY